MLYEFEYFNDSLNTFNESFKGIENFVSLNEISEEKFIYSIPLFSESNSNLQENHPNVVSTFLPEFFPILNILDILNLSKNEELKTIIESVFNQNKEIINENKEYSIENTNEYNYMRFLGKKKVKKNDDIIERECLQKNLNKKNNRGRKIDNTEYSNKKETHDKYKADNIIKKLKAKFFKYGIKFLNKIIGLNKNDGLVNLSYDNYINNLKRDDNLDYLNMKLLKLYSQDISSKNIKKNTKNMSINNGDDQIKNKDLDYNKQILEKQKKKDDVTLNFVLNMTFRDFIDLFTGKKKVEDLVIDDEGIDCSKIQRFIEGKEEMLMEIKIDINNILDKIYFQKYIFYMYNYERWFYIKHPRKTKGNLILKETNSSTNFFSIL